MSSTTKRRTGFIMPPGGTDAQHEGVLRVEAAENLAAHALSGRLDQAVALLGVVGLLAAARRWLDEEEA